MLQVLTDEQYKAQRGETLAEMVKFWKAHAKDVRFDLSPSQRLNFARRVVRAQLGLSPDYSPAPGWQAAVHLTYATPAA